MADGSAPPTPMDGITPGPDTQREFRDILGRFATGVTVVTAQSPDGPIGMTANSFTSISMDPPLIMWSPAKSSGRYRAFAEAKHFAVHVIGVAQSDIAQAFAKSGNAFGGLDFGFNADGVPLINTCLARFECAQFQIHDAGDHAIILGHVINAKQYDGETLVFCQGTFGRFETGA